MADSDSPWANLTPDAVNPWATSPAGAPVTGTPSPSVSVDPTSPWAGLTPDTSSPWTLQGKPPPEQFGPPQPTASYNLADALANPYTLGLSDVARGAGEATRRYLSGATPGFDYREPATEIQRGREAYAAEHPATNLAANALASVAGPGGLGMDLLKGVTNPLLRFGLQPVIGGALGGAQGAADNPNDPLGGATTGAEWGAGTAAALPILGKAGGALFPELKPGVSTLRSAGVEPTPGQAVGGFPGVLESGFSHIPVVGAPITAARTGTYEGYLDAVNRGAVNAPLEKIGETLDASTKTGHAAISEMQTKLSDAYNKAVPTAGGQIDSQALTDIQSSLANANLNLAPPEEAEFKKLVQNRILAKVQASGNATLSGPDFQDIDQFLGKDAHAFLQSDNPYYTKLGNAYLDLQGKLRDWLARVSPQNANALTAANDAWRTAKPVELAAARASRSDPNGIFTAPQLRSAAYSTSSTPQFAAGGALMQRFADDMEMAGKVAPRPSGGHVGDIAGGVASGGAILALAEHPEFLKNPWLLGGIAAGYPAMKALYSNLGRRAATDLLGAAGRMPPAISALGPVGAQLAPQYGPPIGNFATGLLNPNPPRS